jgi:hypothetical protein
LRSFRMGPSECVSFVVCIMDFRPCGTDGRSPKTPMPKLMMALQTRDGWRRIYFFVDSWVLPSERRRFLPSEKVSSTRHSYPFVYFPVVLGLSYTSQNFVIVTFTYWFMIEYLAIAAVIGVR